MQQFLKENMGVIVISIFMFIMGAIVGLVFDEDENGIILSASYPNNGGKIFTIGRPTLTLANTNFSTMNEADAHTLIEKLGELGVENHISLDLREMVRKSKGPFKRVPVEINLHFTEDSNISGQVAKACKNTPIYENPIIAYDLKNNIDNAYKVDGIMSLHAFWENQNLSDCSPNNNGHYDIWVSKKHVESWIGPINPQHSSILVKANIVVSSL